MDSNNQIEEYENKGPVHWTQVYIICALHLVLSVIAARLAWNCSQNLSTIVRLFNTLISSLFSELYILYYAVYRIFMGNKCM
jgi:membrane protein YdbS with pleckstrin-like domain